MLKAAEPLELRPIVARPSGFLVSLTSARLLDQRQHLAFDELGVGARDRVVFAAALAPWAS